MAKPKMQTITRKDWDKKHKDFKLIGKDKIPYIMVYDNGTKLIPVKIIEGEIEESVASAIDQIRQDSKDIRDFLKKVFSDSDFRAMKNDKDFVQYLKSIYEGVSVNEGDGLWANIRAKKARGEKPAHKNSKAHKDAVKAGDKIKKDESVNEAKAFVVMFKVKKDINNRNIKPASAAYSSEVDAKKFLKSVEKYGRQGKVPQ